jgi:hypothetical protein
VSVVLLAGMAKFTATVPAVIPKVARVLVLDESDIQHILEVMYLIIFLIGCNRDRPAARRRWVETVESHYLSLTTRLWATDEVRRALRWWVVCRKNSDIAL